MTTIDAERLPMHVAIIMDGNGRWAKKRGMNRIRGHQSGAEAVREVVRSSRQIGIPYLTLYAFSEENWKRPKREVQALMVLLEKFLRDERQELQENGIQLRSIGRTEKLPKSTKKTLDRVIEETSSNRDMVLTLALSYGARQEILDAVREIANRLESKQITSDQISEQLISDVLYTADIPDPDLLIRTSGEYRISNFLLWQIAYTEIYITPTFWPDFGRDEFLTAIKNFQERERRFGGTQEQLAEHRQGE